MPSFRDIVFPEDIALGCTGGPKYKTNILTGDQGHETRLPKWSQSRREFVATLNSWDEARREQILAFFHVCEGSAYGFRFRDWSDFYAGMTLTPGTGLSYKAAGDSETLGTGDGATNAFQLTKAYVVGAYTKTRKITRPRTGTIRIYVAGTLKTETTHYTINYDTGVVTFTGGNTPGVGAAIKWAGIYDIPARFNTDEMQFNMEAIAAGTWPNIGIVELRE